MKEGFIELVEGLCSIRASQVHAFMIKPENPKEIKVEYGPNNCTTINYASEEDAKRNYENMKKIFNDLNQ